MTYTDKSFRSTGNIPWKIRIVHFYFIVTFKSSKHFLPKSIVGYTIGICWPTKAIDETSLWYMAVKHALWSNKRFVPLCYVRILSRHQGDVLPINPCISQLCDCLTFADRSQMWWRWMSSGSVEQPAHSLQTNTNPLLSQFTTLISMAMWDKSRKSALKQTNHTLTMSTRIWGPKLTTPANDEYIYRPWRYKFCIIATSSLWWWDYLQHRLLCYLRTVSLHFSVILICIKFWMLINALYITHRPMWLHKDFWRTKKFLDEPDCHWIKRSEVMIDLGFSRWLVFQTNRLRHLHQQRSDYHSYSLAHVILKCPKKLQTNRQVLFTGQSQFFATFGAFWVLASSLLAYYHLNFGDQ